MLVLGCQGLGGVRSCAWLGLLDLYERCVNSIVACSIFLRLHLQHNLLEARVKIRCIAGRSIPSELEVLLPGSSHNLQLGVYSL